MRVREEIHALSEKKPFTHPSDEAPACDSAPMRGVAETPVPRCEHYRDSRKGGFRSCARCGSGAGDSRESGTAGNSSDRNIGGDSSDTNSGRVIEREIVGNCHTTITATPEGESAGDRHGTASATCKRSSAAAFDDRAIGSSDREIVGARHGTITATPERVFADTVTATPERDRAGDRYGKANATYKGSSSGACDGRVIGSSDHKIVGARHGTLTATSERVSTGVTAASDYVTADARHSTVIATYKGSSAATIDRRAITAVKRVFAGASHDTAITVVEHASAGARYATVTAASEQKETSYSSKRPRAETTQDPRVSCDVECCVLLVNRRLACI